MFVCIVSYSFSHFLLHNKKAPLSRIDDKNFIGPVHKQVGAYLNIPGFLALIASIHAIFRELAPLSKLVGSKISIRSNFAGKSYYLIVIIMLAHSFCFFKFIFSYFYLFFIY